MLHGKPGGYKKSAHLNDGKDIGINLAGGFYDAGGASLFVLYHISRLLFLLLAKPCYRSYVEVIVCQLPCSSCLSPVRTMTEQRPQVDSIRVTSYR
jgi:hypothetical protein